MAEIIQNYTAEGYQALVDELNYLKGEKDEEIKQRLAAARGFGDLSENSEYDEAKDAQAINAHRIAEIEELLKYAKIIDESELQDGIINLGTTVTVDFNGIEKVYKIVGSNEVDSLNGKISDQSPIGKALINAKMGSVVTLQLPVGDVTIKVLKVERTKN